MKIRTTEPVSLNGFKQVAAIHLQAIELEGTDEGKLGLHSDTGFYAAYFRNLDGHKLNIH